jgi:uncharacterized protein with PhoU and TrkA domain
MPGYHAAALQTEQATDQITDAAADVATWTTEKLATDTA